VVDTTHRRRAVRVSPDVDVDALTLSRYSTARCHLEWLCRDAKPLPGLTDGHARAHAQRNGHCHASVRAVTLAQRAARQPEGAAAAAVSLASCKRRACKPQLIERIPPH
jgi:hypothetical protein